MSRMFFFGILLLVGTIVACVQDKGAHSSDVPSDGTIAVLDTTQRGQEFSIPTPPDADFFEITQRLRLKSQDPIPHVLKALPPPQEVGQSETFTVTDLQNYTRSQVTASLRVVSPHAYWYVANDVDVDQGALERSGQEFENKIYPTDVRYFGDTIKGGFDGDKHLTILTARFNGAAGYYSSPDEYPRIVHPFSNQRLMLYINGNILKPGNPSFNSVVAHELQHALHWHADPNEESWVNEGLSVLAEDLNGFRSVSARTFQSVPDVQLTHWEDSPSDNSLHYAAAHLFLRFLGEHYGGYEKLKDLVVEQKDGIEGVDAFLEKQGAPQRFRDVFKDWVVANFGNSSDPNYRYQGLNVQAQLSRRITQNSTFSDQVHQYAAKYIEVKPDKGSASLTFAGSPIVRLLPTQPPSGQSFWWSNRGDSIDTTLTREFDLSSISSATLRFKAWFDIEKGWDYAYVEVSEDGGATWTVVSGSQASAENPLGQSYGPGYTGTSGGSKDHRWVQESIDLTPYARKKILVRFEYITDEAVNNNGLALDDVEVPELNFLDDAEQDRGWDAHGFFRTDNLAPEDFVVQLVEQHQDGSITVNDLTLDEQQRGQTQVCCFGSDLDRVVVIVAAMAPATTEQASFQLDVQTGP